MPDRLTNLLAQIEILRSEIDALRPLSTETEQQIMQKFRLDWNYHSNRLEGNRLSFGETKTFLLHGLTASGKPLQDHLEIGGHQEAILLLEELIRENRPLTEVFIRELHKILLVKPYYKKAITQEGGITEKRIEIGQYKTQPNHVRTVTGEIFYFASPEETPAKMHDLMEWYRQVIDNQEIHSVVKAALLHYRFIRIHPFDDGNGRTARILMNLVLMKKGLPPVVIKAHKKEEYYQALQQADGGNEQAFVEYIAEQMIYALDLFLRGAKGENIENLEDLDQEIHFLKTHFLEKTLEIDFSKEQTEAIFQKWVLPFSQLFDQKLSQFDDFFEIVEKEKGEKETIEQDKKFLLKYHWKNIQKNVWEHEIKAYFIFEKTYFKLFVGQTEKIIFYQEPVPLEFYKETVANLAKIFLERVRVYTSK